MILASASPRRRAILDQLGIAFEVVVPEVEELAEGHPRDLVLENARRKAAAVEGEDVLGADTTVALDGAVLGKPADRAEARSHLQRLSGGTHEVWSAVAFRGEAVADVTSVTFRDLGPLLDWYVDTGEWEGKAGAYAIQGLGAALVERIEGDYNCVVGLPVAALLALAPDLIG
ncbi:MAG TPA: Maf family protein [Thermoleophilaceae bacterium]|nr:Maf family protein [Thermoleophilaceae bacterium]